MNIKHEVSPAPVISKYFTARSAGEVDRPRLDERKVGVPEPASRSGTEESRVDPEPELVHSTPVVDPLATVNESDEHESRPVSKRTRRVTGAEDDGDRTVAKQHKPKKRRLKRGYAPPEVYAHLNYVQDCLDYDLNILFCGINPGQKSAGDGHHFANPLNGFWRCLHQGGLTDVLVPPCEDHTLPERFKLGIINLVDRPSAEMTELSLAERRAAVPGFLQKVHKWRPKIVCMVGKGIWEDVFAYASKVSKGKSEADGIRVEECPDQAGRRSWAELKANFEFDIQPICLLHGPRKEDPEGESENGEQGTATETIGSEERTLFFVVPSTSSRVLTHQLPDKIILFQLLMKRWEELTTGTMTRSIEWQIRIMVGPRSTV
ncbi:unnamed protein product [Rhizoctonia solani]|uniref:Uracil-DNA glycosylase-like domain-containing protein n=1 Tax=Rhizoctonia solani TaxID=456999 RepID=A0A8H3HZE3_9AGAM|nr:unnamed protein product [Rhizoctonia solani]